MTNNIQSGASSAISETPITWVDVARRLSVIEPADTVWTSKPAGLLGANIDWMGATFEIRDPSDEAAVIAWLGELFPSRVRSDRTISLDGPASSSALAIEFEVLEIDASRSLRTNLGSVEGRISFGASNIETQSRQIPIIACHSVKGGTGRTTTAIALASLFASQIQKPILVVDADLEAPGLSYLFRASRPEALISLEDIVALAHVENHPERPQTVAWSVDRLSAHKVGNLVILPLRRVLDELASSSIRAEHLATAEKPFALADLLERIAISVGCGGVVVDLRAGLVPLAAQFVLDPSVFRVVVTSLAGQSLEATTALMAFVARELRKAGAESPAPLLVVNRIPGILRDLAQDEAILAPSLEQIIRSLLADRTTEVAASEPLLDDALEINPLFVAKLGEVGDLQVPANRWEGFSSQLESSGFLARLLPQIIPWLDTVLEQKQPIQPLQPETPVFAEGKDVLRQKLGTFASKLIAAETGDQPVSDPLITHPIRALAMDNAQVPIVIVEGAKGTGKSLTARYVISRQTLAELARGVGVDVPSHDALFLPVLGSIQASGKFSEEIDAARFRAAGALGNGSPQSVGSTRAFLREKLTEQLTERQWTDLWLDSIAWSSGMTPGVGGSGVQLLDQLRSTGQRLVCVVEGIEELYDSATSPNVGAMLRAILIDLPIRLRSEPGRPLGLIVFARRDSVNAGVLQNRNQFRSQYQDFALTWTESDVLELAAWIATKSEALRIWSPAFANLTQSEKERLLFNLWGRKLGPDDQPGQSRVKEAYTAGWVIAALSDLQGRLVARDLVRFLQTAAQTTISDERDPYPGRLLAPSSLKAAIGPTSREKVKETEEEIAELAAVFAKFREKLNSVKAPIDQDAIRELALGPEDIELLRVHGIILGDAPPYEVPELFRMGLGLRHAGARHSVIGTRRRARQRLKQDS